MWGVAFCTDICYNNAKREGPTWQKIITTVAKNTNIITKINDTISNVLRDFPPVVQTIAKVVIFGGLILLVFKAIGCIFPVVVNVLFELLTSIVTIGILALIGSAFVYQVKLQMTRDENSFLLNERLKYQKKEYEERERRRQERDNRR